LCAPLAGADDVSGLQVDRDEHRLGEVVDHCRPNPVPLLAGQQVRIGLLACKSQRRSHGRSFRSSTNRVQRGSQARLSAAEQAS